MKKKIFFIIILIILLFDTKLVVTNNNKFNIGLLIMATGKYINFVEPLINSAEKYFCKNHNVTYFVFTDAKNFYNEKAVVISQSKLGWPYDTMMRFETYYKNIEKFKLMDYIFGSDADMLFVDDVGDEILSDLVGTLHPGFYKREIEKPYERRSKSTAYVKQGDGEHYFAGGFFGGSNSEILKLLETTSKNIRYDLNNAIIAAWHDESHLNRYFINNKPSKILSPSYCYPEDILQSDQYNKILELPKKLIALAKNHNQFRRLRNQLLFYFYKFRNQVCMRR